MISVEHITYKVGKSVLLDDVSAQFEEGQLHLIIGANGAGKSTLLKVLSKQITAQSGNVSFDGNSLKNITDQQLARFRAVLSQSGELAFPLRVWEVVMMGRYPHFSGRPANGDEKACEETMKLFDVWDFAERNYLTLSGGEKQRVHFARVMAQIWYPYENFNRCLILDEPLTFLDVHYQFGFMNILTEQVKKQNLIVIGVLHDLNLAARFANHVLLIHHGKIMADGNVETVFTKENIHAAFNIEPAIMKDPNGVRPYLFF
jgi:iron complex transport system ATP-binding protein